MSDPVDFQAYKNQTRCIYCGDGKHKTPLSCPRVSGIDIDPETGWIIGVRFWPEFSFKDLDDPPPAA